MRNGYRVFDADAHVVYPADLWSRFLDPKYAHRIERTVVKGTDALLPTVIDGHPTQDANNFRPALREAVRWTRDDMVAKYGELMTAGFTGDRVAAALEVEGVDVMVIYGPEHELWFEGIDPEMQAALCRAYSRWGQEMRDASGLRISVSAPVALADVGRAVEEIQYAYDHLDARCFWGRPDFLYGRNLGDRYYDPIWELLQELDCAFATHDFQGLNAQTTGTGRYRTFTELHSVLHPMEAMHAVLSMICNGVFERFPRLRCAYMEAGCGWLPSWLHRIDEHLELAGEAEFPELTMSATDYFKRNCWISTECDDRFVVDVVRSMGDDHIVFETDFPHPDSKYPHATEHLLALCPELITMETKAKILWDNPVDLYRFPAGYLKDV